MYYGHQKTRQMARSILPSKAPRMASKAKKSINRKYRRHYRQFSGDIETFDREHWHHQRNRERLELRLRRRDADKLSHFERWAVRVTADIRQEDRLSTMRRLLPDGLIGRHALSHLEVLDEFDTNPLRRRYRQPTKSRPHLNRQQLARRLHEIAADPEQLSQLNRALTTAHRTPTVSVTKIDDWGRRYTETQTVGSTPPPLLRHPSDVGQFLSTTYAAAKARQPGARHPEWLAAVKRFVAFCQ